MKIYLSGALAGRVVKEVKKERSSAIKLLSKAGIEVIDPAVFEKQDQARKFSMNISLDFIRKLVSMEKFAIDHCDALVILTGDIISSGTWLEFGYAKYHCKIPVILISKKHYRKTFVSWSNVEADIVVENVPQAVKALKKLSKTLDKRKKYNR
jgi:nucleoside 2-deoxyribosyltransferase